MARVFSRVHATLYVTMSVGRSVRRSVRPSVQNHFAPKSLRTRLMAIGLVCLRRRKMFIPYQYPYNVIKKCSELKTTILAFNLATVTSGHNSLNFHPILKIKNVLESSGKELLIETSPISGRQFV